MVDTRSNMQLSDLNYRLHGGKGLQNLIDCAFGVQFYPPPGLLHYQLLPLGKFHGTTHISCYQRKKIDIKKMEISSARNCTTKDRADPI